MRAASALRALFDAPVAAAVRPCADGGGPLGDGPFEAERRHVAGAVPKRRAEFAAVRACARDALAELGGPRVALVPNPDRSPRWPAGFVGSLTHSSTSCAAVVARASDALSLGLDLEVDAPLDEALFATVCAPRERRALDAMARGRAARFAVRLFSAKEAFYKCQYPLTGARLACAQVELALDIDAGTFVVAEVELPGEAGRVARRVRGRLATFDGHVAAAAESRSRFRTARELCDGVWTADETTAASGTPPCSRSASRAARSFARSDFLQRPERRPRAAWAADSIDPDAGRLDRGERANPSPGNPR